MMHVISMAKQSLFLENKFTNAANTLKVGLLEKNVTSDQIIKIDMIHENKAAARNINGL